MLSTVPLESYHMCLVTVGKTSVFVQISLALAFGRHFAVLPNPPSFLELNHPSAPLDITVLVSIMTQVRLIKSMHPGVNVPAILKTLNRDAEIYFVVISSSHTSTVIMYPTARVGFFAQMLDFTPY